MEYKGRIIAVLFIVLVHTCWVVYGFLTNTHKELMDLTFQGILFSLELVLSYWFGKKFDYYKALSEKDFLTKLYNRRYAFKTFTKLTSQLSPNEKINIFVIDINDFKKINDTYGHKKGDYVIKVLSKCLVMSMRDTDIIVRLGGDEFLIIAPNQKVIPTELIFTRVERTIERLSNKIGVDVSVSIGKSVYPDSADTLDNLIKLADKKMYKNKIINKKKPFYKRKAF